MPICQVERIDSHGRRPICSNEATWIYSNGAYRRLECDAHAEQTRRLIRYPENIHLERIAQPGPRADGGGEGK